uniref:Damage-control phosphatase ARMT1-like metal-binding domain-containing protein n=1 Tax=Tetraselmis chuii TaxID=63592 RepID=A0A7S1T206_9CHLO|mmetsp:Transcript_40792/g.73301  ORF Transcript_40792/g.73301 Transcript_40792/m.73301 type:complete len:532 (+) Transcript_40792:121-1716(+)
MATPTPLSRAVFPLLADPSSYSPFTFDYATPTSVADGSTVILTTWLKVFRQSIPGFKHHAIKNGGQGDKSTLEAQAADFEERFSAALDLFAADPSADTGYAIGYVTVNCAALCRLRDRCLQAAGFGDIFETVKTEENEKALRVLPGVLRELDSQDDPEARLELAIRGVFAGNIFDLGAAASEELFRSSGPTFQATRGKLASRPWPVDNLDTLLMRMRGKAHHKAVIFVDNAGSDVILGILPLARELLKRGTSVLLAANESPTINDITAAELSALMPAVAALDEEVMGAAVSSGRLTVMSTGSDLPVIDLCALSATFCAECTDADLVLLEGMGRSIETNLRAKFTCDVANLGMIKHPEVAALLGGSIYDCICRFEPARGSEPLWRNLLPGAKPQIGAADVRVSVVWPPSEAHLVENDCTTGLQDLLGEGPLWSPDEGALYWVDIHRPAVHRLVPATGAHTAASLPGWVGCLALRRLLPSPAATTDSATTNKRKTPEGGQQLVAAVDGGLVLLTLPSPAACQPTPPVLTPLHC